VGTFLSAKRTTIVVLDAVTQEKMMQKNELHYVKRWLIPALFLLALFVNATDLWADDTKWVTCVKPGTQEYRVFPNKCPWGWWPA
jgi:hypothetical protein